MTLRSRVFVALALFVLSLGACDRKLEPYDPDEKPTPPDLSKIFPAGAERAQEGESPDAPALPGAPRGAPPVASEGAASGPPVRGTIEIADALAARAPRGGVLFLIARGAAGGPPLAVKRIVNPEFPLDFELGPEDRMIQQMPFAGPLQLSARIDADGNATTRSPGDLQGAGSEPAQPGASGVRIVIDQVL